MLFAQVPLLPYLVTYLEFAYSPLASTCQFMHLLRQVCRSRHRRERAICVRKPRSGRGMHKLRRQSCYHTWLRIWNLRIYYGRLTHSPLASALRFATQTALGARNVQTAQVMLFAQAILLPYLVTYLQFAHIQGCCGLRTQTATHSPWASAINPAPVRKLPSESARSADSPSCSAGALHGNLWQDVSQSAKNRFF